MAKPKVKPKKNIVKSNQGVITDDPRLPNKSLFRVDEVAAYFEVGRSTIYLWIDHGILKGEKYGSTLRISREAILACRFRSKFDPLV